MARLPVLVVNPTEQLGIFAQPAKKRRARKKTAKKAAKKAAKKKTAKKSGQPREECLAMAVKRNSKGQFVKKRTTKSKRRKKRKGNPGSTPPPAPSRRRRRASTGRTYQARARRSSNPRPSVKRAWERAVDNLPSRIAGKLAVSWVVKRWGNDAGPGIMGGKDDMTSAYGGAGWSLWNYILGTGVAYLGGTIGARMFGQRRADMFMESIFDDMLQRLLYTEVIGRSEWAKGQFGFDPIPRGYSVDDNGNRWAKFDDTDYEQGMLGLQQATALGALVPAGPLSTQTPAAAAGMGHLPGGDPYLLAGNQDPYIGAMTFQ